MNAGEPLVLELLPTTLAVSRLPPTSPLPEWIDWEAACEFLTISRSLKELSIVCAVDLVPAGVQNEADWRAFRVRGVLDFAVIGVIRRIADALAGAKVSVFVVSTFETDYVLVRTEDLSRAREALEASGMAVVGLPTKSQPGMSVRERRCSTSAPLANVAAQPMNWAAWHSPSTRQNYYCTKR